MKKLLLLAIVFSISVLNVFSQEFLPKGLTEKEKELYYDFIHNTGRPKSTTPPAVAPRTPAEWEEAQGVIVTWAAYTTELREIVRRAKEAVTVYIICSNPSTVQSYLTSGGVTLTNIVFVTAPFNSVWVRDYGPQSVYLEDGSLAFIDWLYNRPARPEDNAIPEFMANYLGVPFYRMGGTSGQLITTGGNFMADGHGDGYSSELVLTENPSYTETQIDQIKYNFMGINPYIKMDELPYDNIHHIDMHMKLLDEETLLVGQFPEGVSDGPYIEANLQYVLDNFQTEFGREFKVIRIPMVPSTTGQWPPSSSYRTYTNAVILNNVILVPQYHNATLNAQAISIYQEAMPGYQVFGINMENVISASGAIHCITREIAASDPVHISHAKIRSAMTNEPYYTVSAKITSPTGISNATVYWSTNPAGGFSPISMTYSGGFYTANIPAQPKDTNVSYYISATNNNAKTISKPLVAPAGYYTFTIEGVSYNVTATSTTNGSIVPSGVINVNEFDDISFTITANKGYFISEFTVDGVNETPVSTFSLENITQAHTINVVFAECNDENLPLSENFESFDDVPQCWWQEDSSQEWVISNGDADPVQPHTGESHLKITGNAESTMLISPLIELGSYQGARVTFYEARPSNAGNTDQLKVYYALLSAKKRNDPVTIFTENFQSGFPSGWSVRDNDGDGRNWIHNVRSGNGSMISHSWIDNIVLYPDNYLITPQITLTKETMNDEFTLYWQIAPTATQNIYKLEHYSVLISTTGTAVSDFTTLFSETLTGSMTSWGYVNRSLDLSAYRGSTVYIAFRHHNCHDMDRITLDNVRIDKVKGDLEWILLDTYSTTTANWTERVINIPEINEPMVQFAFEGNLLNGGGVFLDDIIFKGLPLDNLLGDVNGDGFINVGDVVWMISHLNGSTPAGFVFENADVNNNSAIDVGDLTALINMILSGAK